jgi:hydrogenase maturation protease
VLTILGCGNPNRRDDGVGVVVAQRLAADLSPHQREYVQIIDAGTDGMAVIHKAEGSSALIIIDASRSGSEPGSIFEVPGEELENPPPPSFSLHDFRWDHALYAGRRMLGDSFPREVCVFLIEAADLSFGLELSEPVARAAGLVVEQIRRRISASDPDKPPEIAPSRSSADPGFAFTLLLRHGSLYLPRPVDDQYFSGLSSVLLMARAPDLMILPVRAQAAGGHILRVINAAGDRAVSAVELLREHDFDPELIDGHVGKEFGARWSAETGAVLVGDFFLGKDNGS